MKCGRILWSSVLSLVLEYDVGEIPSNVRLSISMSPSKLTIHYIRAVPFNDG